MGAAVKVDVGKGRELILGCGSRPISGEEGWSYTRVDNNPAHKPDVLMDITDLPLPFDSDYFDRIRAYQVLEHLRDQGDYKGFFADFSEYWRVLKPNGELIATVPRWNSPWAWGDPSHRRVITPESLTFLNQPEYTEQVGVTSMSDFRFCYRADFDVIYWNDGVADGTDSFAFVLKAIKPSRIQEGR